MRLNTTIWLNEHHAAVNALFADAAAQVGREQERLVELVRRDLDPDLLVLLPHREKSGVSLASLITSANGRGWPACTAAAAAAALPR